MRKAATKKARTVKAVKKPAPLMYVGPTIKTVATQNVVYTEIPEGAKKAMAECPLLANLFVDIPRYSELERQLSKRSGSLYVAYTAALKYKETHK